MANQHWKNLENLILVAGHAIYIGHSFEDPVNDSNWFLLDYQKGEVPSLIEHIRCGVELTNKDRKSLLVFSGGQTRDGAGPRTEAQSYWMIADHFKWWGETDVKLRATTEEFARDSFENLLFGICRFYECVGSYPQKITVVSWGYKRERFISLHSKAIRFPVSRFLFESVNNPASLEEAKKGESQVMVDFQKDPYGTGEKLGRKRAERNPFRRQHGYAISCPDLKGLLAHSGPEYYEGDLPWSKE